MKSVLIVACALLLPLATLASANEGRGVYQRQRIQGEMQGLLPLATLASANEGVGVYQRRRIQGEMQGRMQGGIHVYNVNNVGQGGNLFGHPWIGGFRNTPQVSGSWYARPYPTHLDYFRLTR
jgi:hypothetical protein